MGTIRNGARSFLNLMAKACKLSKTPGFRSGLSTILGEPEATNFFALWDPMCSFVDTLIGLDNWYNQIDTEDADTDGEDFVPGA